VEGASSGAAAVESRPNGRSAFVICTGPRTGSYLLSEALEGTGCLGVPREYFDSHHNKAKWWIDRLGIKGDEDYVDKVTVAGSTPNGVFGLKLLWPQVPDLVSRFTRTPGVVLPAQPTFIDCLHTRFDSLRYVWLRRRNKIAQAISLHRAFTTDIWHVRADAPEKPRPQDLAFNFEEIDRRVLEVMQYDRQWHNFFMERKVKALVVIYEEFVKSRESYERTVREVCRYLGTDPDRVRVGRPTLRQQADDLSREWEHEYRRRKQAARPVAMVTEPVAATGTEVKPVVELSDPPATLTALSPGELIAYDIGSNLGVKMVSGSPRRAWMDATHQRFAYRCLPLVIANQHGWLLLTPARIQVVWDGGESTGSLKVDHPPGYSRCFASSHFGSGILTFSMDFVFRTPPGVNLHVRGPANHPKDGICALEGIVETDWSEATFTMNWKLTRPGHPVVFEEDEPFAMLTPVMRGALETYRPQIRFLTDDPALHAGYRAWSQSRDQFNTQLRAKDSAAQKMGWQRHYIRGETVSRRKASEHQTNLPIRNFEDKRK
jgi:LPS sulfotransferase NodH